MAKAKPTPPSITLRLAYEADVENYERIVRHKGAIGGAKVIRLALKLAADELDRRQPSLPMS